MTGVGGSKGGSTGISCCLFHSKIFKTVIDACPRFPCSTFAVRFREDPGRMIASKESLILSTVASVQKQVDEVKSELEKYFMQEPGTASRGGASNKALISNPFGEKRAERSLGAAITPLFVGKCVGLVLGKLVGKCVGLSEGESVGTNDGCRVGTDEGVTVGEKLGMAEGWYVGVDDGTMVGITVGLNVGIAVGVKLGKLVGE